MALKRIFWPRAPLLIECVCVCYNSFRYIPSASIYCFLFFFLFESFHPMFHACKGISRKTAQNLAFLSVTSGCALIGGHGT